MMKVTMCKGLPYCDSTISLTKTQFEVFANKWNNSTDLGYNRYQAQYYVEVYVNNGTKRLFSTSRDQIMEGSTNGWIFSVIDKNYFDSLYRINIGTLMKRERDNLN